MTVLALLACAPEAPAPAGDTGWEELAVDLDAAGGALVAPSGATVEIPPGALAEPTRVTLSVEGGLWRLSPVDLVLQAAATVCLPSDDEADRVRWITPDGLLPLATRREAAGLACAEIGRFGAGRVEPPTELAGRPLLRNVFGSVAATDTGWHWTGIVRVYAASGTGQLRSVTTSWADGETYGLYDTVSPSIDGCSTEDAWTVLCAQELDGTGPWPGWVQFGATDADGDAADRVLWDVPPP